MRYGGFGSTPDEQKFHKERFERMAKKSRDTGDNVMRAEAKKDDKEFDRFKSPESLELDQNLQEMVHDLKAVRDNAPDRPKEFNAVILAPGTGLGSSACAAQLKALNDMHILDLIKTRIGSSGASGPIVYASAGQENNAISLYMHEVTTKEFLGRNAVGIPRLDTQVIAHAMRAGPKALDQDAIRNSPNEVYALATNKVTGKVEFLDFKASKDMVAVCEASSAIPLFREAVDVNGTSYEDGGLNQIPIMDIIERFRPTHLIILPNIPFKFVEEMQYKLHERAIVAAASAVEALGKHGPEKLRFVTKMGTIEKFYRMNEYVLKMLSETKNIPGVKTAFMWPPNEGQSNLNNDPDVVRSTIYESYRKAVSDFGEPQPEKINLFEDERTIR